MENTNPIRVKTITEFHRLWDLPQPQHPLISVVDYSKVKPPVENGPTSVIFNCYAIAIKRDMRRKLMYGQQEYDFDEGVMCFMAPNQVYQ